MINITQLPLRNFNKTVLSGSDAPFKIIVLSAACDNRPTVFTRMSAPYIENQGLHRPKTKNCITVHVKNNLSALSSKYSI